MKLKWNAFHRPRSEMSELIKTFCLVDDVQDETTLPLLPHMKELVETSREACVDAVRRLRKIMTNYGRPVAQYRAIMLLRIFVESAVHSFAPSIDNKLADAMKAILYCPDPSVKSFAQETLAFFAQEHREIQGIRPLCEVYDNWIQFQQQHQQSNFSLSTIHQQIELAETINSMLRQADTLDGADKDNSLSSDIARQGSDTLQLLRSYASYYNHKLPPETLQSVLQSIDLLSQSLAPKPLNATSTSQYENNENPQVGERSGNVSQQYSY